nr:MAG TPA: hypothetical protein [Caudoviricetes sp.]
MENRLTIGRKTANPRDNRKNQNRYCVCFLNRRRPCYHRLLLGPMPRAAQVAPSQDRVGQVCAAKTGITLRCVAVHDRKVKKRKPPLARGRRKNLQ